MIQYDDATNETAEYAAFVEKFKPKKTTDDYVVTGAILQKMATYVDLGILKGDAQFIRSLDSQREKKKAIFGGGFILSERAAAHCWTLSDREREIIAGLGDRGAI